MILDSANQGTGGSKGVLLDKGGGVHGRSGGDCG